MFGKESGLERNDLYVGKPIRCQSRQDSRQIWRIHEPAAVFPLQMLQQQARYWAPRSPS